MKSSTNYFKHPASLVESSKIGKGTKIWAFVHILHDVDIGTNCNICDHCFIESGVKIGNNVTVKCGISIWKGVTLGDNVMLGPNVAFTNDVWPRSKNSGFKLEKILVKKGATVGANSTILAGVTIGKYAMVGMGSVVTRNVPDYALVYGNPAKIKGWVDKSGKKLKKTGSKSEGN